MEEIDVVDKKILDILEQDSRQPFTEVAKKLGISDVAIKKRVDKLLDKGVIKNFSINIDYKKTGKSLRAFILLKVRPAQASNIVENLKESEGILRVFPSIGSYDFVIEVICKDIEELSEFAEIKIGNIEGVEEVRTLIGV